MVVLFRLYEGSVVRRRMLPETRPIAMQVRSELSYHVLSRHLSETLQHSYNSSKDTLPLVVDEGAGKFCLVVEEGIEQEWEKARSVVAATENANADRRFGVSNLYDVYYFSFIAWMRQIVQSTDDLGPMVDALF
jgi:hypothetical protein